MQSVLVIAGNVIREAIRRKDIYVLAVLSLVVIGAGAVLNFWGASGLDKFLRDISFTVIFPFSAVIAVIVAARQIPAEMQARTLYPLLSKPIGRIHFILGKFLGAYAIAVFSLALFTAEFLFALYVFSGGEVGLLFVQAMYAKCLELAMIVALTLLLSTVITHSACVTIALLFALGWRVVSGSLALAAEKAEGGFSWLFRGIYFAIPHIEFFQWKELIVHESGWDPRPLWVLLLLTLYAALVVGALMGGTWLKFRRQAI